MVFEYRIGQVIPSSGYAISFTNFCQLLAVDGWSQAVHPALEKLLNCRIEKQDTQFVLKQDDGASIPLEAAHLAIQSDPAKRGEVYSAAMNL